MTIRPSVLVSSTLVASVSAACGQRVGCRDVSLLGPARVEQRMHSDLMCLMGETRACSDALTRVPSRTGTDGRQHAGQVRRLQRFPLQLGPGRPFDVAARLLLSRPLLQGQRECPLKGSCLCRHAVCGIAKASIEGTLLVWVAVCCGRLLMPPASHGRQVVCSPESVCRRRSVVEREEGGGRRERERVNQAA